MINCKRCGNYYTEGQKPTCNLFACPVESVMPVSVHDMGRAGTYIMEAEFVKLKEQLAEARELIKQLSELVYREIADPEDCDAIATLTAYQQKYHPEEG